MDYRMKVDHPRMRQGAALLLQRLDPQAPIADIALRFTVEFGGDSPGPDVGAHIATMDMHRAVIVLDDGSRWALRRMPPPRFRCFEVGPQSGGSLWEVEGSADAAEMALADLSQHVLAHLRAEDHCSGVTEVFLYVNQDEQWPWAWRLSHIRGDAGEAAVNVAMQNVYRKLGHIRVRDSGPAT